MKLTKPDQFYEGIRAYDDGLEKTDNPYNKVGLSSLGGAAWWITGFNHKNSAEYLTGAPHGISMIDEQAYEADVYADQIVL